MKLRTIILVSMLVCISAFGQGNQTALPSPDHKPDAIPAASKTETNQSPSAGLFTVNASGNSFASYGQTDSAEKTTQEQATNSKIANATIAQAVFAFFLVGVGLLQWWVNRTQRDIMKGQKDIMKSQADIALGALEVSQIQLRASIHIEIQDPRKQLDFDWKNIIRVEVLFKNTGPTPAKKVRAWARFRTAPFPIPDGYVFPEEPTANYASVLTMGSGEIRKMDAYPPKEQAGYSGEVRCYVYGKITYWDVFGKGERHTNFCRFIEIDKKTDEFHVFSSNREQDNEAT